MSAVISLLMFIAIPGMVAGWFIGQWIGDARWPWWSGIMASIVVAVAMAKLAVIAIAWDSGSPSSVGTAFVGIFQFLGFA